MAEVLKPGTFPASNCYWVCLNPNKSLTISLNKPKGDFKKTLTKFWSYDSSMPSFAWFILMEALALSANPTDVETLAKQWGCKREDAKETLESFGFHLTFIEHRWWATFADDKNFRRKKGQGSSEVEAVASLIRDRLLQTSRRTVDPN